MSASTTELYRKTAHELRDLLRAGEISAAEAAASVQARIEAVEPAVGAYVTVAPQLAAEQAAAADARLAEARAAGTAAQLPDLCGVPLAIKDNMCTRGTLTTCSSKILSNFVPPYDSTVVARLRAAGAVFTGKTNLDEFAMGSSTENSGLKKTANPWDLDRIPGGSSGGAAAAVAADLCAAATGTDTGGSIRQPAALCGVVGLKPTYGLVSRYGLVAFASSLDQIGPLTKDVEDSALLLQAMAGHDEMDSTSAAVEVPNYTAALGRGIKGMRLGMPKEFFADGMDAEVRAAVDAALRQYEALGAELVEVELPTSPYALPTYYLCATAEASSNLARYDGAHYGTRVEAENVIDMFAKTRSAGFGPEVKRRIMLGTYALSAGYYDAYYLKALRVRTLIQQDFERAFERCDLIIGPSTPSAAFKFGEKTDDPLAMYLSDIFTVSVNLAGICGISLPCGFTSGAASSGKPLPIGLQLIGPAFGEVPLLQAAHAYEQATPWHHQRPSL